MEDDSAKCGDPEIDELPEDAEMTEEMLLGMWEKLDKKRKEWSVDLASAKCASFKIT